jgi:zinc transporter ZupT
MKPSHFFMLFLAALAGGSLVFFIKKDQAKRLKLLLSFSGAYLFAITALHLLPEVYEGGGEYIGLYILLGFGFQILLEQFSEGIEHGHIHAHTHHQNLFPWGIIISLSIHAFLEGMPLIGSGTPNQNNALVYGIALHHIPAAFALASVLSINKVEKLTIWLLLVLFALMTPAGALFSLVLHEGMLIDLSHYFQNIMAVVIGIFLHISTTILFESNVDHRFNRQKMMAIVVGAGIAIANSLLH